MFLVYFAYAYPEGRYIDFNKKPYTMQDDGWKIVRNVARKFLFGTNIRNRIIIIIYYYI